MRSLTLGPNRPDLEKGRLRGVPFFLWAKVGRSWPDVGPVPDRAGLTLRGERGPQWERSFLIVRMCGFMLVCITNGTQGSRRQSSQAPPPSHARVGRTRSVFLGVLRGGAPTGAGWCRSAQSCPAIYIGQFGPLWGVGGRLCAHAGPRPIDRFRGSRIDRSWPMGQSLQGHGGPSGIQMAAGIFRSHLAQRGKCQGKWEYIRMNPVRAGLVEKPDDWPYSGLFDPRTGRPM